MIQFVLAVTLTSLLAVSPLILHEMGHWAALRRLDVDVTEYWAGLGPTLIKWGKLRVGMLPIGGAVVPDAARYAKLTPAQRTQVALAGPAASLVYGLAALCAWYFNPGMQGGQGLWHIATLNFLLAGLNLLPIPPLDGFHALSNWLDHRGNPLNEKTLGIAYRAGNGLVYGVGFFVLGLVFFKG